MKVKPEEMDDGTTANRRSWAWADPDNAYNVDMLVNNNASPIGGPQGDPNDDEDGCPWSRVN